MATSEASSMAAAPTTTLYELFVRSAERFPSRSALLWRSHSQALSVSYGELLRESREVSRTLRDVGTAAGDFVGVLITPQPCLASAVLGILGEGLAFVFLSPGDWDVVVGRLRVSLVLTAVDTEGSLRVLLARASATKVAEVGDLLEVWRLPPAATAAAVTSSSRGLAYAILTSGSTGQPKTVRVPHAAIVPNILDLSRMLQVSPSDVMPLRTPLAFDPSVVELFLPLSCGACVLVAPPPLLCSPAFLLAPPVTLLQATPSLLLRWPTPPPSSEGRSRLRAVLLGGEPFPPLEALGPWLQLSSVRLYNLYGVTEVSCWATVHPVCRDRDGGCASGVPLGTPMSGTVLEVRGPGGDKVASGGEGEAFVGSSERVCLLDDESASDLRGTVFRATGDVVKVEGSRVYFVGRRDRTVKRWGRRVSLGRLEEAALRHPRVGACAASASCVPGAALLLAVVWKDAAPQRDHVALLPHLAATLRDPSHLPDAIVPLGEIPLTYRGKVDYRSLEERLREHHASCATAEEPGRPPSLPELWRRYLGGSPGPDDNFLRAGGSSLLAVRLATELLVSSRRRTVEDLPSSSSSSTVGDLVTLLLSQETTYADLVAALQDQGGAVQDPARGRPETAGGIRGDHLHRTGVGPAEGLASGSVEPAQGTGGLRPYSTGITEPDGTRAGRRFSAAEEPQNGAPLASECRVEPAGVGRGGRLAPECSAEPSEGTRGSHEGSECKVQAAEGVRGSGQGCEPAEVVRESHQGCEPADGVRPSRQGSGPAEAVRESHQVCEPAEGVRESRQQGCEPADGVRGDRLAAEGCRGDECRVQVVTLCEAAGGRCPLLHCGRNRRSLEVVRRRGEVSRSAGVVDYGAGGTTRTTLLEQVWTFNLGKCVDASPILAVYQGCEPLVLVGSHSGLVVAVHAGSGRSHLTVRLPDRVESAVCLTPCGRYAILGCYDGRAYCVDVDTGLQRWALRTGDVVKASPVLTSSGETVLVASYDRRLYCVSLQSGDVRWSSRCCGEGGLLATPCVIAGGLVLAASLDGTCCCLREVDGGAAWRRKLPSPVFSSPVALRRGRAALFTEVLGVVHCLEADTGLELWTVRADGHVFSTPCVCPSGDDLDVDLVTFGCHDQALYCLSCPRQGSERPTLAWRVPLGSAVLSAPSVVAGAGGAAAAATTAGGLHLLDLKTGALLCSARLPGEVFSSPVLYEGRVYVGCRDDNLYCLQVNTA